ncbi:MAG: hypothetical protein ACQESF_04845 [Nanobdellota archaeon]
MNDLENKVIQDVDKRVLSMSNKGKSYGVENYKTICKKHENISYSIEEMAYFASENIKHLITSYSPELLYKQAETASYIAEEVIFDKTGHFCGIIKEQLESKNQEMPDNVNIVGVELDIPISKVGDALYEFDVLSEGRFEITNMIMDQMYKYKTNTYLTINDLTQGGIEMFENNVKILPMINQYNKEMSQRVGKHLFSSLVELYSGISESLHAASE